MTTPNALQHSPTLQLVECEALLGADDIVAVMDLQSDHRIGALLYTTNPKLSPRHCFPTR
jgi:hypothetical protein